MDISTILKMGGITPDKLETLAPGVFSAIACVHEASNVATSASLLVSAALGTLKASLAHGGDVSAPAIGELQKGAAEVVRAAQRLGSSAESGFNLGAIIAAYRAQQEALAKRQPLAAGDIGH